MRLFGAKQFAVVSNLPYSCATSFLASLASAPLSWRTALGTVQREVGERLAAKPGSKTYGAATVLVRTGATVELSQAKIADQPSDCVQVSGIPPIAIGNIDVDKWELCVTGDGVLARFEAGKTKAELVDYRAGVPSALLTTPENLGDQPDDPVLAIAEEVDQRIRSLAAFEGEGTNPRQERFLEQVEAENLAIALEGVENFSEEGRLTVRTGRGVACLQLGKRPEVPGTATRGACEPTPAPPQAPAAAPEVSGAPGVP